MRNIFDQYAQPENRLTHALVSCLAADQELLRKFVEWVTGEGLASAKNLEIIEQKLPGEEEVAEDDAERRGLPDAWIHDGNGWAVVLENKIGSPLKREQLERHRRVAQRRGFTQLHLAAIVTERSKAPSFNDVKVLEWRELYSWIQLQRHSQWAHRVLEYMEILEAKLVAEQYLTEGTLTVFSGIPFGNGYAYNYLEAKRLLRLMLNELRKREDLHRELGVDPQGKGRPAITGREARSVWDFLPLVQARRAKNFTEYPHFTLSIGQDWTYAHVTIPNGIKKEYRDNLLSRGKEGFFELLREVTTNFEKSLARVEGASPWVSLFQRHFPSQRAEPIVDADIEFDLRTAFPVAETWGASVKHQPQWLEAVYAALSRKRSNLQVAVGVNFDYDWGDATKSRDILDHIANTWLACKPLIRVVVA
ncbi:MAG: hypothetical protein ACE5IP_12400 [Terriglobia bacterium]